MSSTVKKIIGAGVSTVALFTAYHQITIKAEEKKIVLSENDNYASIQNPLYNSTSESAKKTQLPEHSIRYQKRGTSSRLPTVVVIGDIGESTENYHNLATKLEKDTDVILYDRPGYGHSTKFSNHELLQERDIQVNTEELKELLDKITSDNDHKYIIVAKGYGGLIAKNFFYLYPDKVAGLALLSSFHESYKRDLRWGTFLMEASQQASTNRLLADLGLLRLILFYFGKQVIDESLPKPVYQNIYHQLLRRDFWEVVKGEYKYLPADSWRAISVMEENQKQLINAQFSNSDQNKNKCDNTDFSAVFMHAGDIDEMDPEEKTFQRLEKTYADAELEKLCFIKNRGPAKDNSFPFLCRALSIEGFKRGVIQNSDQVAFTVQKMLKMPSQHEKHQ